MTAKEIINFMETLRNEEQREVLMRFFKTGPGQYGEGDEFLGLKVPQTREVVKAIDRDFPIEEVPELLLSRWHEVRLCGLLILVARFERLATKRLAHDDEAMRGRDAILSMYLRYAEQANNWDLVDLSAPKILGNWLLLPTALGTDFCLSLGKGRVGEAAASEVAAHVACDEEALRQIRQNTLDALAQSDNLWRQRMSMVCTWKTSQQGDPSWCLRYAEMLLHHPHDLMHKAVGWMLREMGKRCGMDTLRDFLSLHAHEMPRTTLRYAIEKMSDPERKDWMSGKRRAESGKRRAESGKRGTEV